MDIAGIHWVKSGTLFFFRLIQYLTLEPGECLEGSVRLADGDINQEGRPEVCLGGVWGSVCGQGWDQTDAHTLCEQLNLGDGGQKAVNSKSHSDSFNFFTKLFRTNPVL